MASEIEKWLDNAEITSDGEVRVPENVIRHMLAQSVVANWPRYEVEYNEITGDPVVLRFGSPNAANKALEMLAKDAGMLADTRPSAPSVEIHLHGVDVEDLK